MYTVPQSNRLQYLQSAIVLVLIQFIVLPGYTQTGSSAWVRIGTNGKLQYTPDAKGNRLPDFSMVGYRNGNEAIPNVAVVKTLNAVAGDNLAQIQAAINEVAAMPLNGNGFRGAILLKKGEYNVSNTLNITAGGIVLKGEGTGTADTRVIATRTAQHTLINVAGSGTPAETSGSRKRITTSYVPTGATSFNVESITGFAVGDEIMLRVEPKEAWITLIGMAAYGWTPSAYRMSYLRTITQIAGNTITVDAPVVDPIDVNYKDGFIYKFTWNRIQQVGIENIRFSSVYSGTEDENHGWTAISIDKAQHCWVRNSHFYYFGYSAVHVKEWGVNISVLNCQNLDPIAVTTGGRKYSFNLNGQLTLFKDCYTRGGRHDYVTGSTTAGPNAFVNSRADNMRADIGPHHRWATGLLFDNIIGSGNQNVQNREESGSGHGWAGAQCLFWNCTSPQFIVQQPPQHFNWAIGCKGTVTDNGNWYDGSPGIWESTGNFVPPQSLYEKQLADRLNTGTPTCEPVIASADDGNVAANVLDNDLNTRWSASGDGQWIQFCLANTTTITGVDIAFYNGHVRTSAFDVLTGTDGTNWTTAAAGLQSSGTSLNFETFTFTPRTGKYVRIVGHGNSVNLWNSYTEVKIRTGGQTVTLSPTHDAYVRSGTYAATTFGTTDAAILITKLNGTANSSNDRHTYLTFNTGSVNGTISSATLRLYGKLDDNRDANIPVDALAVANTTWTESAITWNNKPATGATLQTATVTDSIGRYYTWDITSYVQSEKAAGRSVISLALLCGAATDPRITWNSKETGSNAPQLVITTSESPLLTSLALSGQVIKNATLTSYPNPFRQNNRIVFTIQKPGHTTLAVYNILGKQVALLVNRYLAPGNHQATFAPAQLPAGTYLLQLVHDNKVITQKIVKE
jgi:hypothetical protein